MKFNNSDHWFDFTERVEVLADYLLANGVFLLPEDLRGTQDFSISAFIEAMQMYKEKDLYIKTPCKVGDKVYFIPFGSTITKWEIKSIEIMQDDIVLHCGRIFFLNYDFGKTVFLTKEEAEEKLKECEG